MTIEKTLTSIDIEKMELMHRRSEITKLQTEIIKEKKMIDAQIDCKIHQKCKLEKRKLELLPTIDAPPFSIPKLNCPVTSSGVTVSTTKSPCVIRKVDKMPSFSQKPYNLFKICRDLFGGGIPDKELLSAAEQFDPPVTSS